MRIKLSKEKNNDMFGIFVYLHDSLRTPILHRDIKPSNILVQKFPSVPYYKAKLCDFGMAFSSGIISSLRSTESKGALRGTRFYMAPEQLIQRKEATQATDIWSLGCTFIELFTNVYFWPYGTIEEVIEKMQRRDLPEIGIVPASLNQILQRCVNLSPQERPSAKEMIEDLKSSDLWNQ